jgi:hypothetical protein
MSNAEFSTAARTIKETRVRDETSKTLVDDVVEGREFDALTLPYRCCDPELPFLEGSLHENDVQDQRI